MEILHELPPITNKDCFVVFDRKKNLFDFPIHYHEVLELNFISGGAGTKRIVGDNMEEVQNLELVLVGKNIPHGWIDAPNFKNPVHEVTIQFHPDFLNDSFLERNQLAKLKRMIELSKRGILFSQNTILKIKEDICQLSKLTGFDSVLTFLHILHILSLDVPDKILVTEHFEHKGINAEIDRIEKVFNFLRNNYEKNITLEESARLINLGKASFCRFMKKNTGKSFIENLNEIRLEHVSQLLRESNLSISEISYSCGFNNLSFFNKIFKNKFLCTPKEFRNLNFGAEI